MATVKITDSDGYVTAEQLSDSEYEKLMTGAKDHDMTPEDYAVFLMTDNITSRFKNKIEIIED